VGRAERSIDRYRAGEIETIEVGHLGNQRDFVSGIDAASQLNAIASRGASGEIYHVASGRATVIREVLHTLLADAGVPYSAVREGTAVRTDYDPPVVYADMSRTRALLNRAT
jgi:nucleoside-diphosphate-sugar epimerase